MTVKICAQCIIQTAVIFVKNKIKSYSDERI